MSRHTPARPGSLGRLLTLATVLAVAVLSAGCGLIPDSSDDEASGDATTQAAVATTVPKDEVTITLAYADDPPTKALIAGFEKKYPQVTIKPQFTHFNDYVKSIKLAMQSNNAPDIAEYNPGAMRSLIPAGLVQNLDAYEKAYKWQEGFPPASLDVLRTDKSAKRFGTGSLYAVPGALSVVGVYYNKKLAAKAGITEPPATLDEFDAALAKVKADGQLPLSVGGLDTGGLHTWGAVLNVIANTDAYRDWVYGAPGADIATPEATQATQRFADWAKKGYIAKSANGVGEQDSAAAFAKGKAVFHVNGNWSAAVLRKEMGDDVGFFLMPGQTADAPAVANGASVAWSVSSKSKHKDVAAAFLDYMRSAEAAPIQTASGFMPVDVDSAPAVQGVDGDIAAAFKKVVADDGILPFPDFAAPSMLDALTSGVQGLIAGKTSPESYLGSLQDVWAEYHGS